MAKPTTIKEALNKWAEENDTALEDAEEVGLQFQYPPIEKMDNSLAILQNCRKLSLSTNMIDKIAGVGTLKNLRVLSLARNYIKNVSGLDALADTLEQLWISYNLIERIRGIDVLKSLKVLYIGNNNIKEWNEFNKLNQLPNLEDLLFVGNPLYESMDPDVFFKEASKRLPNLKKLEGEPVIREDGDEEKPEVKSEPA